MHGQNNDINTPNPRAVPPSAVKDVEESRQERIKRSQSRFRDRGGIFVPTSRNTLADILLGRKEPSPKKYRRSRSRSVSVPPQKQRRDASPTAGKNKKKPSLASSKAIEDGKISVGKPVRRSPRKQSTTAVHVFEDRSDMTDEEEDSHRSSKPQPKSRKATKAKAASTSKGGKRKGKAKLDSVSGGVEDTFPAEKSAPSSAKQTSKASAKPKAKSSNDTEDDEPLCLPSTSTKKKTKVVKGDDSRGKSKGKGKASSTNQEPVEVEDKPRSSKKAKSKPASNSIEDEEDNQPLAPKSWNTKLKRKLSIVQEEDEGEDDPAPRKKSRSASPPATDHGYDDNEDGPRSPPPPPKKRLKASSTSSTKKPSKSTIQSTISKQPISANPSDLPKTKSGKRKAASSKDPDAPPPAAKKPKTADLTSPPLRETKPDDFESDVEETSKKPSKSKPPNRSRKATAKRASNKSKKQKENTPLSDAADFVIPVKTESEFKVTKGRKDILGPRKSVLIRLKEPLPPIEDNDPDPIDFLS